MTQDSSDSFADRLATVKAVMAAACTRSSRPLESVTLIAVSKTHPAPTLIDAVTAGIRQFGENRVEEAGKIDAVNTAAASMQAAPLTWHMIGHVQSRKAREVIAHFSWVHSLDSTALAERYSRLMLDRAGDQSADPLNVLLEVNISGEVSKSGFVADQWESAEDQRRLLWDAVQAMIGLPGIRIHGLMTVAPVAAEPEQVRPFFAKLRKLRDALVADFPQARWESLSMGMTDDYPIAIEEGATFIRIGRALFGSRIQ